MLKHWNTWIADVEVYKLGDTLRDVEAEALANGLVDRLEEIKAKKVGEILTDLKAASPVVTLDSTLAESRDEGPERETNHKRSCAQGTGRHACFCISRGSDKDN